MMKIVAVVILIAAALLSGHHWRMPSTTTERATVQSIIDFAKRSYDGSVFARRNGFL
jgi:hypothetical protein